MPSSSRGTSPRSPREKPQKSSNAASEKKNKARTSEASDVSAKVGDKPAPKAAARLESMSTLQSLQGLSSLQDWPSSTSDTLSETQSVSSEPSKPKKTYKSEDSQRSQTPPQSPKKMKKSESMDSQVSQSKSPRGKSPKAKSSREETTTKSDKNASTSKSKSKRAQVNICYNLDCKSAGAESLLMDMEDLAKGCAHIHTRECMGHCGDGPNATVQLPDGSTKEVTGLTTFEKVAELAIDVLAASKTKRGSVLEDGAIPEKSRKIAKLKYEFRRSKDQSRKIVILGEAFAELGGESCLNDPNALSELLVLRSQLFLGTYEGSSLADAQRAVELQPKWHRGYAALAEALGACFSSFDGLAALEQAENYGHEKTHVKQLRSQLLKRAKGEEGMDIQALEARKTTADWNQLLAEAQKNATLKSQVAQTKLKKALSRSLSRTLSSPQLSPRSQKVEESHGKGRANNYGIESTLPPTKPVKRVDVIDIEDIATKLCDGAVSICRCYKSQTFPYCDGAHKEHNCSTGDNAGPAVFKACVEPSSVPVTCLHSDEEKAKKGKGGFRANNYGVVSNIPANAPERRVDFLDMREIRAAIKNAGVVSLCRCYKSSVFPFCDGSHNQHNAETGDNSGPVLLKNLTQRQVSDLISNRQISLAISEKMSLKAEGTSDPNEIDLEINQLEEDLLRASARQRRLGSERLSENEQICLHGSREGTTEIAARVAKSVRILPGIDAPSRTWLQKSWPSCCRARDENDQDTDGEEKASIAFDEELRHLSQFSFSRDHRIVGL